MKESGQLEALADLLVHDVDLLTVAAEKLRTTKLSEEEKSQRDSDRQAGRQGEEGEEGGLRGATGGWDV
eukprot:754379-Hanusia_phi.AAC.1